MKSKPTYKELEKEIAILRKENEEYKSANEELLIGKNKVEESEEKYRLITENSSDLIWILNVSLDKFTYMSPAIYKLSGYTVSEALQNNLDETLSEESAKKAKEIIGSNIHKFIENQDDNITQVNEFQQKHKDGSLVWVETSTNFHYNSANEIEILGITRNIEDRKKAKKAIEESEEKYRLIAENVSDVIWIFNVSKNKFTYTSPSEFKNTGYTVEESDLLSMKEKITPESAKRAEETIQIEIQEFIKNPNSNNIQVNDFQQKHKDGSLVWIETSTRLRYNSAKEIEIIGITRNINDRKKVEQELIESEAKLRESNKTKDKFFSIIAHDLKSPFNAILGFSNILVKHHREYDDEKREKLIKSGNSSAKNAFKLLENLLTWSSSQSGAIEYEPEKLHLKILLFETMLYLQGQADKKNINILDDISENELIYADKNMIATVLRNLISNAIKFTNNSGNIIISSNKNQTDNNYLEILVEDTGVGIAKNTIDNLFRIDKNTSTQGTEKETGTGLGLILCKEFVEKHGGKIWVESEINKGSTFYFTIPNK